MIIWTGIQNFLNSSSFVGFSTIFTVFGAYILYRRQKKVEKQQIAALLVNEIRNAEDAIQRLKARPDGAEIPEIIILPQNNWNRYSHLFTKDLDQDHVDSINRFYFDAERANYIITYGNTVELFLSNARERMSALHEVIATIIDRSTIRNVVANVQAYKDKFFTNNALVHYSPQGFSTILNSHLESITYVLNTPAGLKLKKIAGLPH